MWKSYPKEDYDQDDIKPKPRFHLLSLGGAPICFHIGTHFLDLSAHFILQPWSFSLLTCTHHSTLNWTPGIWLGLWDPKCTDRPFLLSLTWLSGQRLEDNLVSSYVSIMYYICLPTKFWQLQGERIISSTLGEAKRMEFEGRCLICPTDSLVVCIIWSYHLLKTIVLSMRASKSNTDISVWCSAPNLRTGRPGIESRSFLTLHGIAQPQPGVRMCILQRA